VAHLAKSSILLSHTFSPDLFLLSVFMFYIKEEQYRTSMKQSNGGRWLIVLAVSCTIVTTAAAAKGGAIITTSQLREKDTATSTTAAFSDDRHNVRPPSSHQRQLGGGVRNGFLDLVQWLRHFLAGVWGTFAPGRHAAPKNAACTCRSCTDRALDEMTPDGLTCRARIQWLLRDEQEGQHYPTEAVACARVANIEYPLQCSPCDPVTCDGRSSAPAPPSVSPRSAYCGCDSCTYSAWRAPDADGLSCEAHVTWLQIHNVSVSEISACHEVGMQFPQSSCGRLCTCGNNSSTDNNNSSSRSAPTVAPVSNPTTSPTTRDNTPLYCFPPSDARVRYGPVWGSYKVEVKEDSSAQCGPGNNRFSHETVSLVNDTLTLQFKRSNVTGEWLASEVRVVPADGTKFNHGKYDFSIQSVSVLGADGNVLSNQLPAELVLGFFTWDDTDKYVAHENWNHEVDIELSRWGNATNEDAQFLMQPPGSPQQHRFATGGQQGGHRWQFTWNPGEIAWSTTAGGGQSHSYKSAQAILDGQDDLVQCLPANYLDVRINLWNMYGGNQPSEYTQNEVVEVVIDDFVYTPSGKSFIAVGDSCSKNCQCEKACANKHCVAMDQNIFN
jgi:hypothetical protein